MPCISCAASMEKDRAVIVFARLEAPSNKAKTMAFVIDESMHLLQKAVRRSLSVCVSRPLGSYDGGDDVEIEV